MAKTTVYLNDDQLRLLRRLQGAGGRGGVSRAFQVFLENATGGSSSSSDGGRYDYARKLMPISSAIERQRIALAEKVQSGGPPADGGPVAAALTLLVYKRLLESDPTLGDKLDKEFARFGLDELVATETEGVDLLAEPADGSGDDEEDEDGSQVFGFNPVDLGHEVAHAFKHVGDFGDLGALIGKPGKQRRRVRRVEVTVTADDDPREVLAVADYETFTKRHPDWEVGAKLTPSQVETVADLVRGRAHRQRLHDED